MGIRKSYTILHLASALFMIVALLWLTVSAPFVFAAQQEIARINKTQPLSKQLASPEEESAFGCSNTTEEKSPGSTSLSEEYLHEHHKSEYFYSIIARVHTCEHADTYQAYHGEVQVPPPNVA